MTQLRTRISYEIEEALRLGFTPHETAELFDVDVSKVYGVRQQFVRNYRRTYGRKKKKVKKKVRATRPRRVQRGTPKPDEFPFIYDVYEHAKIRAEKLIESHRDKAQRYVDAQGRTRYCVLGVRGYSVKHPGRLYRQEPKASKVPSPMALLEPEWDWLDTKYVGDLRWENLSWRERRNCRRIRSMVYDATQQQKEKRRKTRAEIEEEKTLFAKGYTRTSWGWQAPEEGEDVPE